MPREHEQEEQGQRRHFKETMLAVALIWTVDRVLHVVGEANPDIRNTTIAIRSVMITAVCLFEALDILSRRSAPMVAQHTTHRVNFGFTVDDYGDLRPAGEFLRQNRMAPFAFSEADLEDDSDDSDNDDVVSQHSNSSDDSNSSGDSNHLKFY